MPVGPMQYGTSNNAGGDETGLTSTAGDAETLDVRNANPGIATAIRAEAPYMGIVGTATSYAVFGYTNPDTSGVGVYGRGGLGVFGRSHTGNAIYGDTDTGNGVKGESFDDSFSAAGVYGFARGANSNGVIGEANNGAAAFGVWGKSTNGFAGFFSGKVQVTGTLFKPSGGFKIDHPLDPENKYLCHSFVESPDMLNVYSGNVTTDTDGNATITLPEYFEVLNQDFRYQLTVIGQFAQAIVAQEVRNNQFTIQTDQPQVKVSWQVTGVRKDPFANMHRILVEEDKPADERRTYLHPEAYGQPETRGVGYARETELKEQQPEVPDRQPPVPQQTPDQQL